MSAPFLTPALTSSELLEFAARAAADTALIRRLKLDSRERTWLRLDRPGNAGAWVIGWPPGSGTGWHDHGGSSGAFVVARGTLHELTPPQAPGITKVRADRGVAFPMGREVRVRLAVRSGRSFPADHLHDVRNFSATEHAVSIHVYAPKLRLMHLYEHVGDRLLYRTTQTAEDW